MMKQTDNSHTQQVSVAVIDNYDSFTYNLVHLVRSLGAQATVFRNDSLTCPTLPTMTSSCFRPVQASRQRLGCCSMSSAPTPPPNLSSACALAIRLSARSLAPGLPILPRSSTAWRPRVPICSATTSSATFLHALPWAVTTLGWSRGRLCQLVWRSLLRATRAWSWRYAIAITMSMASSSIQRVCSRPRAPLLSATG